MNELLRSMFLSGGAVASVPLLFLSVLLIALFQIPAQALMRAGLISAGVAVNQIVAVAGVPIILTWALSLDSRRLLPLKRPALKTILLVIALTLGADIIIDYLTAASELFIPDADQIDRTYEELMAVSGAGDFAIKLVVLCALPAICEEIYFRGFLLTSIAERLCGGAAIAISALVFAMLHGNFWYVHLYFCLGLLLGWVYWTTGSLWPAILCHFMNNAWAFINHTLGFKLPLSFEFWLADAASISLGVFLLAGAGFMLKRSCLSSPSPHASTQPRLRR